MYPYIFVYRIIYLEKSRKRSYDVHHYIWYPDEYNLVWLVCFKSFGCFYWLIWFLGSLLMLQVHDYASILLVNILRLYSGLLRLVSDLSCDLLRLFCDLLRLILRVFAAFCGSGVFQNLDCGADSERVASRADPLCGFCGIRSHPWLPQWW